MKQKDKEALTSLLNQTKDHYKDISHAVRWTAEDSARLDDILNLQKDIGSRLINATRSTIMSEYVPSYLIYKAWERTKAVYSFDRALVDDLTQTNDTELRIYLLEHLPFRDMLLFFTEGTLPKTKNEETAGVYVHIERHPEYLWIVLNLYDRTTEGASQIFPGVRIAFPITDGQKVSELFDTPEFQKWMRTYRQKIVHNLNLNKQEVEERLLDENDAINTTINLLYYLSAKNADIKPIKSSKKYLKTSSITNEKDIPAVELSEVGSNYAEIVYRRLNDNAALRENDIEMPEEDRDDSNDENDVHPAKRGKKRRPHVRRGFFRHYWTGKGRTELELRWINDSFVGTRRDDQATVVYDATKAIKGKRNANTSKKKREK